MSSLREVEGIKPILFLPRENLAEDVLIPCLKRARVFDCMMGFFTSESLAQLAPGLSSYITASNKPMRLIISPFLSEQDREAIESGLKTRKEVIEERLCSYLLTEDALTKHTLRCLSYLIRKQRLIIQIALLKGAIFHPKVWLMSDDTDQVAVHGSGNMTSGGIVRNFEQITVSMSWLDSTQRYIIDKLRNQFNTLWDGKEESCLIFDLPTAVAQQMLKGYNVESPPTEEECLRILRESRPLRGKQEAAEEDSEILKKRAFAIPAGLNYREGPYEHQGRAVEAWCRAGFKGILEMATGSGKTIAAMIGAHRLYQERGQLLIVVAAPYLPLVAQWSREIKHFGIEPVNLALATGASGRGAMVAKVARRLRMGLTSVEALVVTHDTICNPEFIKQIGKIQVPRLFVADEVHNLGREQFIRQRPEMFEFRLGLSATPQRQYDLEGTQQLVEYFGGVVFLFPLKEAIGRCLVPYDYFVHKVQMTQDELGEWAELTEKIRKEAWRIEQGEETEYIQKLLRDRRLIVESAHNKLKELSRLLDREKGEELRHVLIYATDKNPEQLREVNRLLQKRGVVFHQLTHEETAKRDVTERIIASFQRGEIQVLTAKRVLDEGVDIPQISKAYILASTTVERQWVQRRGRLLRTCEALNKRYSTIHDFLVCPPTLHGIADSDIRKIMRSELQRIKEFARLSRNAGSSDGALATIDPIVQRYFEGKGSSSYATQHG